MDVSFIPEGVEQSACWFDGLTGWLSDGVKSLHWLTQWDAFRKQAEFHWKCSFLRGFSLSLPLNDAKQKKRRSDNVSQVFSQRQFWHQNSLISARGWMRQREESLFLQPPAMPLMCDRHSWSHHAFLQLSCSSLRLSPSLMCFFGIEKPFFFNWQHQPGCIFTGSELNICVQPLLPKAFAH